MPSNGRIAISPSRVRAARPRRKRIVAGPRSPHNRREQGSPSGAGRMGMLIGLIGLGTMGRHMAANLQKGGFKIVVNDLRREAAAPHLAPGAVWADTPKAVAAQADVVFTSLPEPPDVEKVALGDNGLLAGIRTGAAWFDLSTNAPKVVKALNA